MKISIVGTGYVGLVSGACFAETGIHTTCVDINKKKISKLKQGIIPIYEPGLDDLVENNVKKERLLFTTSLAESLTDCLAIFIAVGTPPDEDGSADLKYVLEVAREIGRNITDYIVIITKSTVPIGTAEKVRKACQEELDKRGAAIEFDVASNPEFLKEGAAIADFLRPERIVIGVDSPRAKGVLEKIYKPFLLNGHPIIFMNIASSELTKYAANSMLATRISFMNDIANLCDIVGGDINMVRKGIGADSRIGNKFLYAGIGYGGSCFPKDVKALIKTGKDYNHPLTLLEAVETINDAQKAVLFNKLLHYFKGNISGKKIALWGLSFKPNTDDMREAPALTLIEKIQQAGGSVSAYDPVATEEARRILGDSIEYANDQYEAANNADALLIVTEWREFRMPHFDVLTKIMKHKAIFDGRNIFEHEDVLEHGFHYECIGRNNNSYI
ncbi:MAG: UDP-glucose/GDP-mannose dehydrogenase family protein [Bacteroidales bacterium]|jgi:UDPglucose 6-dehydrogenase|nr:UDP-glucose/GDP-mannose dehydrogenase family protein [Bacteroidales bacterium]